MLHELSISQLNGVLRKGEVKLEEVINYFVKRTEKTNPELKAFLDVTPEQPAKVDFSSSKIAGVPFAVKDNIVFAGHKARASSKILEGFKSTYTATALNKLLSADAVYFGRTNCDEFGMGASNENSAYGPVFNPWDVSRVPGGSSGGSVAAVTAGLVPYALGSDTGGSIRQPASLCGVVGLKPTYGRVSRYGLLALASSFDTIGSITRGVEDAALVLEQLAGHDPLDATTINKPIPNYSDFLNKGIEGLRIGIPKEYFSEGLDQGTEKVVRQAIKQLENLGAEIIEVSLPRSPYSLAAYYIILPVEASANLSRYDGIKYGFRDPNAKSLEDVYLESRGHGFGPEVKRRIMLGAYASSSGYYDAYYKQALKAQKLIRADFKKVFSEVDCLVTPTSPTTAFKIGERANDPLAMYLADIMTVGVNLAGVPAVSIPCGFDKNLPVGMQLIAPWFKEEVLFQIGGAYEGATNWSKQRPPIFNA